MKTFQFDEEIRFMVILENETYEDCLATYGVNNLHKTYEEANDTYEIMSNDCKCRIVRVLIDTSAMVEEIEVENANA
jgi:hypothetical protein